MKTLNHVIRMNLTVGALNDIEERLNVQIRHFINETIQTILSDETIDNQDVAFEIHKRLTTHGEINEQKTRAK